jgi:hypothetical protein
MQRALSRLLMRLTGRPRSAVPHRFNEKGNPTSLLAPAKTYQDATDWHRRHAKLFLSPRFRL